MWGEHTWISLKRIPAQVTNFSQAEKTNKQTKRNKETKKEKRKFLFRIYYSPGQAIVTKSILLKFFIGRLLSNDHGLKIRAKADCNKETGHGKMIQTVSDNFHLDNPNSKELTLNPV